MILNDYKIYPNPYIVLTHASIYSKHYYAGSQRVASRLLDGADQFVQQNRQANKEKSTESVDAEADFYLYLKKAGFDTSKLESEYAKNQSAVADVYYYHGDHLGSSTYITNSAAETTQFFLNLPFGETMAEQMTGVYDNPFKFNAKELDSETGFYYYGARYYNPRLNIWYSVDPLAEKMPSWSPYAYAFDNPIKFTDPDGREPKDDYRLNRNGTFALLKKTNDNFDRVYNSDKSKSIEITKGIIQSGRTFKNTQITTLFGVTVSKGESYNSSFYFARGKEAVGSMSRLNRFISNNSDKEFSFQKFENKSGVYGALSTDYKNDSVGSGNKVIDFYMADPTMKMTYNSHNHPGGEGYAYPSGFKQSDRNYDFVPDLTNASGDRTNYIQLKARYGDRIPDTFRISVGGTNQTVIYDDKTTRVSTPTLTVGN